MRLMPADVFTFLNMTAGALAVWAALEGGVPIAAGLLAVAFLADGLDGYVAKRLKQQRKGGMYLDSLADICAFGFAPFVIALILIEERVFAVLAGLVFVAAGIYRLARFQDTGGSYQGMPITANGVFFPLLLLLLPSYLAVWVPLYFLASAGLMASKVKLWN